MTDDERPHDADALARIASDDQMAEAREDALDGFFVDVLATLEEFMPRLHADHAAIAGHFVSMHDEKFGWHPEAPGRDPLWWFVHGWLGALDTHGLLSEPDEADG